MQQSQQHIVPVKHHLPQPNSLLPNQILISKPANHLISHTKTISAQSGSQWMIDETAIDHQKIKKNSNIINSYDTQNHTINALLNHPQKLAYIHRYADLPNEIDISEYQFSFASLKTQNSMNYNSLHLKKHCNVPRKQYPKYHHQLMFDDEIESGNLYMALRHDQFNYILASRFDYNTKSYGQWFFFKVCNPSYANIKTSGYYTFSIVNMTKNGALFGKGLKISVCRKNIWSKQGKDISYYPNNFARPDNRDKLKKFSTKNPYNFGRYYTLTFTLFIEEGQTIYIAYNQPYTYHQLNKFLDQTLLRSISEQNQTQRFIKRRLICNTPLNNHIQILTISNKNYSKTSKKIIIIMARAHPVEVGGSFVMQGIIKSLMTSINYQQSQKNAQNHKYAKLIDKILDKYTFKIIPMINPDGVIVGNSRCNVFGYDLNRQWKNANYFSPQIKAIKNQILKYEGKIQMLIDLHGHSKKKNVFAYGCHDFRAPFASRQFPYLLSKIAEKDFQFKDCRFTRMSNIKNTTKQGTARISLWNKLKIPNIFTLQHSYCGSSSRNFHYDSIIYHEIGQNIIKALSLYFYTQSDDIKITQSMAKDLNNDRKIQELPRPIQQKQLKTLKLERQLLLKQLKRFQQNIEVGLQSQDSSESEQEDRIKYNDEKQSRKVNRVRKLNNTNKKQIKQGLRRKNRSDRLVESQKKIDNNNTSPEFSKFRDPEIMRSISQTETHRKKIYKHLQPIHKRQQMKITKCEGFQQNAQSRFPEHKSTSQPLIRRNVTPRVINKDIISVIQIGKQSFHGARQAHRRKQRIKSNNRDISLQDRIVQLQKVKNDGKNTKVSQKQYKYLNSSIRNSNQVWQPTIKPKRNINNMNISTTKFDSLLQKINSTKFMMKIKKQNG